MGWRAALVGCVALALAGCPAHVKGLVSPSADGGTVLQTTEGDSYRLQLSHHGAQLAYLDGHLVEVWGRGNAAKLKVDTYRIHRGTTGMTVFVGMLQVINGEMVLEDPAVVGAVRLDDASLSDLIPHVGRPVLIEGYVEGAQRVKVVKWRVLADTPSSD